MNRRWQTAGIVASALAIVAGVSTLLRLHASPSSGPPSPVFTLLSVGPETTLLTEPLRPDGTVDFVAAINQRCAGGITPENNALVALLPAIGTRWLSAESDQKDQLAALGAPESGGLFVEWNPLVRGEGDARIRAWKKSRDEHQKFPDTPWTPTESEEFNSWLNRNAQAMKIVREAVQRPRYWMPLVSSNGALTGVNVPCQPLGKVSEALCIRAMRSAGSGQSSDAWDDLLTTHKLSRLVAQDHWIVSFAVAMMSEQGALQADLSLLRDPRTDRDVVARMLADLESLQPLPTFFDIMQRKEIYEFPAAVQSMAKASRKTWETLPVAERNQIAQELGNAGLFTPDWDHIARTGNGFFHDLYTDPQVQNAAALREWLQTTHARVKTMIAAANHDERTGDVEDNGKLAGESAWPRAGETRETYSDRIGRALLSRLTPEFTSSVLESMICSKRLELTRLACALVLCRLDTGAYPDEPDDVGVQYLGQMPTGFWGRPIAYTRTADGFKLEAWGPLAETQRDRDTIIIELKR